MLYLLQVSPHESQMAGKWSEHFGQLATPLKRVKRQHIAGRWALDNGAYSKWDSGLYIDALKYYKGVPHCLFAVAPDVVADHEETLKRFHYWKDDIRKHGYPIAFVLQDGLTDTKDIPLSEIDAIFVGGTTPFKLSQFVAQAVNVAKECGKWVHMGRVNSRRRLVYAHSIGVDSVDGNMHKYNPKEILNYPVFLSNRQKRIWD